MQGAHLGLWHIWEAVAQLAAAGHPRPMQTGCLRLQQPQLKHIWVAAELAAKPSRQQVQLALCTSVGTPTCRALGPGYLLWLPKAAPGLCFLPG